MRNDKKIIFLCIIFSMFAFACSHSRKISSIKKEEIKENLVRLPYSELLDSISAKNILPEDFNCRFDADFTNKSTDKTDRLKGIISFNSNEILMQVTSKGINIATILIDNDSILILNKLKKTYYTAALSEFYFIEREVTLTDIKNILLGMKIDFFDNELFNYSAEEFYSLYYRNKHNLFYNIDYNKDFKAEKMRIYNHIDLFYVISYFDFLTVENNVFPTNINIDVKEANLNISLSRINFEKKSNLEVKIPLSYEKSDEL